MIIKMNSLNLWVKLNVSFTDFLQEKVSLRDYEVKVVCFFLHRQKLLRKYLFSNLFVSLEIYLENRLYILLNEKILFDEK